MTFFDDSYRDKLQRKFERGELSRLARPAFRLATLENWQNLRESINTLMLELGDPSRTRLRKKKWDLENISQIVNEIKVGIYLDSRGFELEYEPSIDGLTPDWLVKDLKSGCQFLVEVFSKRESDQKVLAEEFFSDLREASKKIEVGAVLAVRPFKSPDKIEWTDELLLEIFSEIENWIAEKPAVESRISPAGIEIELVHFGKSLRHVELIITSEAFWVNSAPVGQLIEEKVAKYSDVCQKNELPLVAACRPSFSTGISQDEFGKICPELFLRNSTLTSVWAFIDEDVSIFDNPSPNFYLF